jgi:glutamyl-tRNA synthetase|tara:strand:+ start:16508 stop:18217 length:1710 start_codon:yes stop_codon:yes gene_type:complete
MSESDGWSAEVVTAVRKFALQNALEYDGEGQSGSVLGRLLSERPELRPEAKRLMGIVSEEVESANAMAMDEGVDAVRAELERSAPDALEREKHRKIEGLKELPGNTSSVVLRFAPNPNGPLTLGHSRGVVINSEYAKMHDGKVVLRFDDTDTRVKPPLPDAYQWIEDEYEWLAGRPADIVVRASDRMPIYLEYARKLLADGHCYVCRCPADEFRNHRESKEDCPCRSKDASENLAEWESMNDGTLGEGDAVVRIRTDMTLPNPALRDWPALRIQQTPHPMVADRYRVWPLLDFQSAIEDYEQGVTHIVRGKDLMDSTRKQSLLYEHLGWQYPETLYWGRVKVHEFGGFSTSSMRASIESGDREGWGDLRLPTIQSLRRRGFDARALRNFWVDLGVTQKDISVSMQTIESLNSSALDATVERRSFVASPVSLDLDGHDGAVVESPRHPNEEITGTRSWVLAKSIYIQEADCGSGNLRLKEFADISISGSNITIDSLERSDNRPIVQWLPESMVREAVLFVPNGDKIDEIEGLLEDFELKVGNVYQLERIGFATLEKMSDDCPAELVWLHG